MYKQFLLVAACLQLVAFSTHLAAQGQATPVRGAVVVELQTQKRSLVSGTLRALRRSALSSLDSGLLAELRVRRGEQVEKGQIIGVLDVRRLRLAQERAEITVQIAEAELAKQSIVFKNQKNEFKRRQQANEVIHGSISEEVLEQAESQVAVRQADQQMAQQQLIQARNELALAVMRLKDAEIVAPFDGFVVEQHAEVGEWITPGQTIVTVVSSGMMEAVFEVPEQQAMSDVVQMKQLQIMLASMETAIVSDGFRIVPDIDSRSRRYILIADVDPKGMNLASGMSVTCAVASGAAATYLMVPTDALMRDVGGAFVFKISQASDAAMSQVVPVKVLFIDGDNVAVSTPALSAGDLVVVEGNERLRPMMPLQVLKAPAANSEETINQGIEQ